MVDRHINIILYKHMHVCAVVGNINKPLRTTGRERVRGEENAVAYSLSTFLWGKTSVNVHFDLSRVWKTKFRFITNSDTALDLSHLHWLHAFNSVSSVLCVLVD